MISSLLPSSPPLHHKRPRGLWKGRRETAAPKLGRLSHDFDLESLSASTSSHEGDTFDDDFDDGHSSDSSYKRRRLSGGLSDTDTLWHHSPASRSLTPDLSYHAPSFPSHNLKSPPYSPLKKPITIMYANPDVHSSINSSAKGKQPSTTDLEDWQNLKELFARASDSYDSDDTSEALPLLRAVIRECHRFMREHPDPSLVYSDSNPVRESRSPASRTPTEERSTRDWTPETLDAALRPLRSPSLHPQARPHHQPPLDPPTAFHAIFGTALFYMGTIISQDSSVALSDEPSTAPTYWLAALDVFETGENLPSVIGGSAKHPEDWRMAVSWGRTLVSLAEEKLNQTLQAKAQRSPYPSQADIRSGVYSQQAMSSGPFSIVEPRWPPSSPFHAIAASRPPVTRRMSLLTATPHDIMVLAMDQFSRGIFHMPHPHYSQTHNPSAFHLEQSYFPRGSGFSTPLHTREHSSSLSPPPGLTPGTGISIAALPSSFSRPKELFMIASEVLGVAERLSKASQREYWAAQADSVFNQMKMEADMSEWRMAVNAARGRCWLVVGEARAEEMEDKLEKGEMEVLHTAEAEEAREGLAMAVTFFERAKGSATAKPNPEQEDLSPLLAEALLTLANLTLDENSREELYARAQAEGGDSIQLDLDPPPKALPAAISTIAVATNKQPNIPPLDTVVDRLDSSARSRSLSMEASPAVVLAGRGFQPMSLDNVLGLEQPMVVDSTIRRDDIMDES